LHESRATVTIGLVTLRQSGTSATEATIQAGGQERPSKPPHERIGRYVVLEEVGAGAMGRVLRAYDPRLRREVALKLVRAALDETSYESVMHEAQAMAQLAHPNIVAVYDADVVDGEPFLAMEYVEGGTLADWIAEGARPWSEVLEVFTQAGQGLAAAHEAGIVHRDFKPGNVMRRSDGRVQVTDFGIAMEADAGDAHAAGTPGYMAPEQHEGAAADARSDQYAFCVSLWEALTGQRPFDSDDLVANKKAMRLRMSAPIRALPKPARDALQRGLSPDPSERHASIEALLSALAFTPGRTRSAVLGAGTVAVIGLCLVGWQWHREAQARERCDAEADMVPALWDDASRASVREAFVASGVANGGSVFERAAPWLDAYAKTWADTRREQCLAQAKDPLSQASAACLEEHRLRFAELIGALARADAGVVNRSVKAVAGLRSPVECSDEQSLRVRAPLPTDDERREQLAKLQGERARLHASLAAGRAPEIAKSVEELLDQARAIDWAPAVVDALLDAAEVREAMSDFKGARAAAEEAFARALAEDYDVAALSASTRLVYVVGYGMSKHDEGLQWSRTGDAIARRLGFDDDHPRRLALLNNTGVLHWARGDYESAKAAHQQAIEIKRTLLGPEHPGVASSLDNYGITLATMGDLEGARVAFESSLELTVAALGEDHPSIADAVTRLGTIASELGETKLAREYLERSLALTEAAVGPEHSDVALVLINLATTLVDHGAAEEALSRAERAMGLLPDRGSTPHPYRPSAAFVIGQAHSRLGHARQAVDAFEETARLRRATLPDGHPDRLGAEVALAQARLIRARSIEPVAAMALVDEALAELPEHERTEAIRAEIEAWRASAGG